MKPLFPTANRSDRARFALRLGQLIVVLLIGIAAFNMFGRIMAEISQSSETVDISNVAARLDNAEIGAVKWVGDATELAHQPSPLALEQMANTWLRAWGRLLVFSAQDQASGLIATGHSEDALSDYFTRTALKALRSGASSWADRPVHQISHDLSVSFFAADSSLAAVRAETSRFLRSAHAGPKQIWVKTQESYAAILVRREDNWKIEHLVRTGSDIEVSKPEQPRPTTQLDSSITTFKHSQWRAITYAVPGLEATAGFVAAADPVPTDPTILEQVNSDMKLVADLGFNAIRIEIPAPESDGEWDGLEKVTAIMDSASDNGLGVSLVVLIDQGRHEPVRWRTDIDHMATIASAIGRHRALRLWEIGSPQNLKDRIEAIGPELTHIWASTAAQALREHTGGTPLTVTWPDLASAMSAPMIEDVVSLRFANNDGRLVESIDALKSRRFGSSANPPIILNDLGFHTYRRFGLGTHTETNQAKYFTEALETVEQLELAGFGISTLKDQNLDQPRLPASKTSQTSKGLIRDDGSLKPAAQMFSPQLPRTGIPRAPLLEPLTTSPFLLIAAVGATLLLIAGMVTYLSRRWLQHPTGRS